MKRFFLVSALLCIPTFAQAGEVAVSIKPIHSLVENLTRGTDIKTNLIVSGRASLHSMTLKPSQTAAVREADAVILVSEKLEAFLTPLTKDHRGKIIQLEFTPGLQHHPVRSLDDEHDHEAGGDDLHLWTSPQNARMMAKMIAKELSIIYPQQAEKISSNSKKLDDDLLALHQHIKARMEKLKGKKFAVFHDATQYFDREYGLSYRGALTLHPEQGLSAGHMQEMRNKIKEDGITCVFREPGFDMRAVKNMIGDTKVKTGLLDAEALAIPSGQKLYSKLLESIASSMENCLE